MKQVKNRGYIEGPFVAVLKETMDSPAWIAMSQGAKVLYITLKRRYNSKNHNNGRVFLSTREAAKEMGCGQNEICRWYRELQHYAFIVQTAAPSLGVEGKGKAAHWCLTECGYMKDEPTRDFLRWDGTKFRDAERKRPASRLGIKTESRLRNHSQGATEKHSGGATEKHSTSPPDRYENHRHIAPSPRYGNHRHTKLTTTDPEGPALEVVVDSNPNRPDGLDIPDFLRRAVT